MSPDNAKKLGSFIKRHREDRGLSYRQLAAAAGIPVATVYRIERGDFESPAPPKLQRLAQALEVKIEDLYALAGYLMPEGLPDLAPYISAKYNLPARAVKEIDDYVAALVEKYAARSKEGSRARRAR